MAALSGCAVAPDTTPVALDVPAAWTSAADTPAAGLAVDTAWWRSFGNPELDALIGEALVANPDLAAARQRIARAAAIARGARADLYPVVDASASASRSWQGRDRASNGFRAGFDASYEADLWGLGRAGVTASEADLAAAGFDRQALGQGLAAEVAATYFQYLSLGDRLDRAQRVLGIAERILTVVEAKATAGAASGLELAQQRGAVASLRASLPDLARSRAETANALAALVGTHPGRLGIAARTLEGITLPEVAPGLPSEILVRRPDIRRAEAQLAAARADVAAARAAMLPAVRLTGSAGYASDALADLFDPAGFLASLAAGIVAPVFDAGRLEAQRDATAARAAELAETYRGAVIAAFRDVESALAAIRYLAEAEAAQQVATAEARRANDLAEIRYRAGAVEFLTVLETQRSLFQQEEALAQTRYARLAAAVGLYKALGGGW